MPVTYHPNFLFKSINNYPTFRPNNQLFLVNMGYEKCPPDFQINNKYDFYRIYVIKSGSGTLDINNFHYELCPNTAYLIRPNEFINKKTDANSSLEYCFFAFDGDIAKKVVERTYFKNNNHKYAMENDMLCNLILKAVQELASYDFTEFFGLEHLFQFLKPLTPSSNENSVAKNSKRHSLSKKHFQIAKEYIDLNYNKPILIDDICQILNLSRSYLFRIFEKHTGTNVSNYLTEIRLEHAKRLLVTTDYSTATIANLVGYVNSTTFYRVFKKAEKITPSEWRAAHKE